MDVFLCIRNSNLKNLMKCSWSGSISFLAEASPSLLLSQPCGERCQQPCQRYHTQGCWDYQYKVQQLQRMEQHENGSLNNVNAITWQSMHFVAHHRPEYVRESELAAPSAWYQQQFCGHRYSGAFLCSNIHRLWLLSLQTKVCSDVTSKTSSVLQVHCLMGGNTGCLSGCCGTKRQSCHCLASVVLQITSV